MMYMCMEFYFNEFSKLLWSYIGRICDGMNAQNQFDLEIFTNRSNFHSFFLLQLPFRNLRDAEMCFAEVWTPHFPFRNSLSAACGMWKFHLEKSAFHNFPSAICGMRDAEMTYGKF